MIGRPLTALLAAATLHGSATVALAQSSSSRASDTAFSLSRNAVIDIAVASNDLIVRGSDRPTAELRSPTRGYKVQSSGVAVSLSVGGNDDDGAVQLFVPRGVRLVVHGASGDVSIADVTGDVEVHLHSGDIHTRNLGARAILETISGDIGVDGGVGDLRVTTVSGDVTAHGVRGSIDVNTTSGTIVLAAVQTPRVQVEAMSGDIVLSGSMQSDARIQLTTHSGDVSLRLPDGVGGTMDVTTVNGEIEAGGMTLQPTGGSASARNARTKRFEFGGGGNARISISTFNGEVAVQRQRRSNEEQ